MSNKMSDKVSNKVSGAVSNKMPNKASGAVSNKKDPLNGITKDSGEANNSLNKDLKGKNPNPKNLFRADKKAAGDSSRSSHKAFRMILLLLFAVAMFYPPFLRGLYFEAEQLPTQIIVFVIFIAYWIYKVLRKERLGLNTPLGFASFGLVIVYFISIFAAVSLRTAIEEWLKYCMYFAVFLMISGLASTNRSRSFILWGILAAGTGVSVLGIDSGAGGFIAKAFNGFFRSALGMNRDVFFGLLVGDRINSTLQYPNATASYLLAAFIIALLLVVISPNLWQKAIAGGLGVLIFATTYFTLSRGIYVIMPFVLMLFVLLMPKGFRVRSAAYLTTMLVAGLPVIFLLSKSFPGSEATSLKIWGAIGLGFLLEAVLIFIASHTLNLLEKLSWKVYAGVIGSVGLIAVVGIAFVFSAKSPLVLDNVGAKAGNVITQSKLVQLAPGKSYKLEVDVSSVPASNSTENTKASAGSNTNASGGSNTNTSAGSNTNASEAANKELYAIKVSSKSFKDVVSMASETELVTIKGKGDASKESISFTLPSDSRGAVVYFSNIKDGATIAFSDARIVDAGSGRTAKGMTLKYKYIPQSLAGRLDDIFNMGMNNSSVVRGIFSGDGLKIMLDHPIVGAGGGAWQYLYSSYQSYMYDSTQAHNFFVQLGVETGILGFIMIAAFLASLVVGYLSALRRSSDNDPIKRVLQGGLLTGIVSLLAHAAIDFDLSLAAIYLMLWQLAGLYQSTFTAEDKSSSVEEVIQFRQPWVNRLLEKAEVLNQLGENSPRGLIQGGTLNKGSKSSYGKASSISRIQGFSGWIHYIGILVIVSGLTMTIMFSAARNSGTKAGQETNNKNYAQALVYMENAAKTDPFHANYRIDTAKLIRAKGNLTKAEADKANQYAFEAEKLGKYDNVVQSGVASYYLSAGDIPNNLDMGMAVIDHLVTLGPLRPVLYQQKASANLSVANYFLQKNDKQAATKYLDVVLGIPEEIEKASGRSIVPIDMNKETKDMVEQAKTMRSGIK